MLLPSLSHLIIVFHLVFLLNMHMFIEGASSAIAGFGSTSTAHETEGNSSTIHVESLEEGEFTPVISKKTKKKVKLSEREKAKPVIRGHTSSHALMFKSAKHKRF